MASSKDNPPSSEVIKESMIRFITDKIGTASNDALDEFVLSYIVSVVEDVADSSENDVEEVLDIEAFKEMLEAVVPEVEQIADLDLVDWIVQAAASLKSGKQKEVKVDIDLKMMIAETTVTKPKSTARLISVEDESSSDSSRRVNRFSETSDGSEVSNESEDCQSIILLQEMFPLACSFELHHCLQFASGNLAEAAQLVIQREESGESIKQSDLKKPSKTIVCDEKAVKDRILGRYGFVDQEDDSRYHRPMIKQRDDKKMIRYRDGKIVSTKGERFTQVSKQESDEMKKSLVNINPSLQ